MSMHEVDDLNMLKPYESFLKTEVVVTKGIFLRKLGTMSPAVQVEGHTINITITNTAPIVSQPPMVVFTGVHLTSNPKYNRSFWGNVGVNRYQQHVNVIPPEGLPKSSVFRIDGRMYYETTQSDQYGYYLFPGQSLSYEIRLSTKECPDINDLQLKVQATLSRRHLFQFEKDLTLPNT